ncbi:unnamed protein product, partial [Effrenium voratum]
RSNPNSGAMLFGQPGVDPRIQTSFDSLEDLPWASTYHSYQPHLGFQHMHRGCASMVPHPWHAFAPDAELHAFAFVMPGNDHTSVVPEDWNGWLPPHPEQMSGEPPTPRAKSRKEARKHKRPAPKISEEVARRMQSQLQSATRGVSLRKIFGKYDADRSGTLTSQLGQTRTLFFGTAGSARRRPCFKSGTAMNALTRESVGSLSQL